MTANRKLENKLQQWLYEHRSIRKRTTAMGRSFDEMREVFAQAEKSKKEGK